MGRLMGDFHDWDDIRAELHDRDDDALEVERARTEAWISAYQLAKERKHLACPVAGSRADGVAPGRVRQIENRDLGGQRGRAPEPVRPSTGHPLTADAAENPGDGSPSTKAVMSGGSPNLRPDCDC
ncbi:hypothetical protein Strop_4468 [Salinispora tropica CNB-440]|uniref:Uncharacterized protein n=1 Tax=Salinispora tropica (strain ATCC BAA-916 / DSM 44818 / JCM 13857 / NBRC 105044 / CNB-440) TaxID=369723 RepID=A4XD89_SALTO|nr:hypothetical protein Strop_4468 [Salinispora tropica CNB-440]